MSTLVPLTVHRTNLLRRETEVPEQLEPERVTDRGVAIAGRIDAEISSRPARRSEEEREDPGRHADQQHADRVDEQVSAHIAGPHMHGDRDQEI